MASILIADDVALARDGLARALRDKGHRVSVASDGQDAVDRFGRERPELVILDMMMPRVSGLEACARIKQGALGFVPVIMISARGDLDTRLQALAVAEDFVPKPYEAQEVCARVDAHLRTRRLITQAPADPEPMAPKVEEPASSVMRATRSGGVPPRLLDREQLVDRLVEEWKRCSRTNDPLALLVAGVDVTAPGGDAPVVALLGAMQRSLRSQDAIARIDEQHAAGLLLGTHMTGAMAVGERLRRETRKTSTSASGPLIVSMGFSFFPNREVQEPNDMLRLAERAIARAREEGPGRICLWQHQGYMFDPQGD